jgi:hypothetical protein
MLGSSAVKMRRVNRNRPTVPLDVSLLGSGGPKAYFGRQLTQALGIDRHRLRGRPPAYRMSLGRPENIPVGGWRLLYQRVCGPGAP